MSLSTRLLLIAAVCVGLGGCAGLGKGRRERAQAPPAAERTEQAQPTERRRGRLSIPRFGRSKRAAPSEPVAVAPPPRSAAAAETPPAKAPPPSRRANAKPAPAAPGQLVALAPDEAKRRIVAYLRAKGYSMQQEADEAPKDVLVTDPLLTDAKPIEHLAECGSSRLGKPILHSRVVEAKVAPDGTGSRVAITGRFVEVRQQKIGDSMAKVDCPSRGVLEAEVLGALSAR